MPIDPCKALMIAAAGLLLAGCNTTSDLADGRPRAVQALAMVPPPPETTGSIGGAKKDHEPGPAKPAEAAAKPAPVLPGDEPQADAGNAAEAVAEGRDAYRANHFREAERHFRRATEIDGRNSEAWIGLAASSDRLHDFAQADRAYGKAKAIAGPTAEVLNNQGYSYMLRGDLKRARDTLLAAQKLDPRNKYVENNLILLDSNERKVRR